MKKSKKLCAILLTGGLLFGHGMVANAMLPPEPPSFSDMSIEEIISFFKTNNFNEVPREWLSLFKAMKPLNETAKNYISTVNWILEETLSMIDLSKREEEKLQTLLDRLAKSKEKFVAMQNELYKELPFLKGDQRERAYKAFATKIKQMKKEFKNIIDDSDAAMKEINKNHSGSGNNSDSTGASDISPMHVDEGINLSYELKPLDVSFFHQIHK